MEKRGRERLYSLNRTAVSEKLRALADAIKPSEHEFDIGNPLL